LSVSRRKAKIVMPRHCFWYTHDKLTTSTSSDNYNFTLLLCAASAEHSRTGIGEATNVVGSNRRTISQRAARDSILAEWCAGFETCRTFPPRWSRCIGHCHV